jgi:hypothetical protein
MALSIRSIPILSPIVDVVDVFITFIHSTWKVKVRQQQQQQQQPK